MPKFQRSTCYYKRTSHFIVCFEYGNWVWALSLLTGYFHSYFLSINFFFTLLACQTVLPDWGPVILERNSHLVCQILPSFVLALSWGHSFCLWWFLYNSLTPLLLVVLSPCSSFGWSERLSFVMVSHETNSPTISAGSRATCPNWTFTT